MGQAAVPFIVLAVLVFSGCTGASSESAGSAPTTPLPPPAQVLHQEGGGALRGIVTDDESLPIEGARVQIGLKKDLTSAVTLATNFSGMFRADGLAAGDYLVLVSKEGYYEIEPETVKVLDNDTTTVHVELSAKPDVQPFHATTIGRTHVNLQVCVTAVIVQCTITVYNSSISPIPMSYKVNEAASGLLQDVVVEAIWTPTVSVCTGAMATYVFGAPYLEDQQYAFFFYDYTRVESPTYLRITRSGDDPNSLETKAAGKEYDPSGKWQITPQAFWGFDRGTAVDVDCMVEQPVTTYATFFFGTGAPDAWSIKSEA